VVLLGRSSLAGGSRVFCALRGMLVCRWAPMPAAPGRRVPDSHVVVELGPWRGLQHPVTAGLSRDAQLLPRIVLLCATSASGKDGCWCWVLSLGALMLPVSMSDELYRSVFVCHPPCCPPHSPAARQRLSSSPIKTSHDISKIKYQHFVGTRATL